MSMLGLVGMALLKMMGTEKLQSDGMKVNNIK